MLAFPAAGVCLAAPVVRQGGGATPGALLAIVDQFRTDLGGANNGVGESFVSGQPVVQIPVESGGHGFAAGADHEDELLERIFSLQAMAPVFTFVALAGGRAGRKPGPRGASGREHQNPESPT